MARCTDCIHFSLCDYNTNISGDSKINLFYDKGAEKCSFYKPTADVVEVKHGEWEQNPYCKRIYYCSKCGRHIEDGTQKPQEFFPYCHCGAKMNGTKGAG